MEKNQTKNTFSIFLKHAGKYKLSLFLILFTVVGGSLFNRAKPLFYKELFDAFEQNQKDIYFTGILIKILIVNLISWFFWRIASFTSIYFQSHVMTDLSNTCFRYIHLHSVDFFNNNFVGSLVKKVNRFSHSFEVLADIFTWEFLTIIVDIIFITSVLFLKNKIFALVILAWVFIYITISYFFSLYKLKYDIRKSALNSKVTGLLADSITNNLNIKLFTGYQRENENFGKANEELRKTRQFTWNLGNSFNSLQGALMLILEFGIFYFAINLWKKDIFTIGDLVLLQSYLIVIFLKLWGFSRVIRRYYENMADAKEMTEILETPHEITDSHLVKELKVKNGEISFEKLNFCYHQTRKVLNNFNLKIKGKEKIALVGISGSGKSTIVNLLLRNFDISSGKIKIDDQKINHVTQESLRKNISYVPQDSILFHRTLMENIRYGKPSASNEEVIEAAKLANCHQFIKNFPEKYETYVGERGVKLSGGERQRIAIARAILKNAPILILDEATSSLDSESEQLIQNSLETLMKNKTVIAIAHRLSTIMKMDRIIVLNKGEIFEEGKHEELLKLKNGIYQKLWRQQINR